MPNRTNLPRKLPFFSSDFPLNIEKHRLSEKPTGQYALHWHNFFEIEFIVSGRGHHYIDDTQHPLSQGWLYVVKPSDRHSLFSDPQSPLELFTVQFDSSMLSVQILDKLLSSSSPLFTRFDGEDYEFLYHYLSQMVHYSATLVDESKAILKSMLSLLCQIVFRNTVPEAAHSDPEGIPYTVQKAISYIMLNLKEDLTIKTISNKVNLSPNYLGHLFREHTGMAVNAYVNKLRLERALEFLEQTELSVQEIAHEVGFASASYFVQKYREHFGVSPSTVRSNLPR